ncbi:hypothetical protein [Cohaesibacter haloalkalitolerans]|uniref:hypothetical protein n=1 Tax=Cohaesibacter haloalkalitolerans TaxID=1162980 RepID=UPI0013C3EF82|nr:hypothetical protein [Cohaesibacter haloalkalitolerans]
MNQPERGGNADVGNQTDACCETKAGLIPLDKAVALALAQVSPISQTEQIDLAKAVSRIVAEDMFAPEAMPFFDNSAMDGFALALSDLGDGNSLPLAGTVAAGSAPRDLPKGMALEIFTGAPFPFGCDTIVMFEDTTVAGDRVHFQNPPKPGRNIRRQGSAQPLGA